MLFLIFSSLQAASLIIGAIFVLSGLACAYVGLLSIEGKFRPNSSAGVKLNFSRNWRLFNQEKYWYEINRYGGKLILYIAVAWSLLTLLVLVLPLDAGIRMGAIIAIALLAPVALTVSGWLSYRYADSLVSGDISYIPKGANIKKH